MRNIVRAAILGTLLAVLLSPSSRQNGFAWAQGGAAPSAAAGAGGQPTDWDSRIPLPKGAVMTGSTAPKEGSKSTVYSVDFSAPGDYDTLVKFYETELPKAGFKMGPKISLPARKIYNRSFTWTDILDTVQITPDSKDPSKMTIHIAYTPPPKGKAKSTSGGGMGMY